MCLCLSLCVCVHAHQIRLPLHVPQHRGEDLQVLQPEAVDPPRLGKVPGGGLVLDQLEVRLGQLALDPGGAPLARGEGAEDRDRLVAPVPADGRTMKEWKRKRGGVERG